MRLDGLRINNRAAQPSSRDQEGGSSSVDLRALAKRIREADLDPEQEAQISQRVRNYIAENSPEQGEGENEGSEFNPRAVANRVIQSDLSREDKAAVLDRIRNYVNENSEGGNSGQESEPGTKAVRSATKVSARAAIEVA